MDTFVHFAADSFGPVLVPILKRLHDGEPGFRSGRIGRATTGRRPTGERRRYRGKVHSGKGCSARQAVLRVNLRSGWVDNAQRVCESSKPKAQRAAGWRQDGVEEGYGVVRWQGATTQTVRYPTGVWQASVSILDQATADALCEGG